MDETTNQKSNGSQDLPKLGQPSETEELRLRVRELEDKLASLESAQGSSFERLELPARASRDELIDYIFRLQRKVFDLEADLSGDCTRCGRKRVQGCTNGSIEISEGHGGRHRVCQNLKDEDTFFESQGHAKAGPPAPVNAGFLELMSGKPSETNETADVTSDDEGASKK